MEFLKSEIHTLLGGTAIRFIIYIYASEIIDASLSILIHNFDECAQRKYNSNQISIDFSSHPNLFIKKDTHSILHSAGKSEYQNEEEEVEEIRVKTEAFYNNHLLFIV